VRHGEIRRESCSNHFATALDGIDIDHPGMALDRSGHPNLALGKMRAMVAAARILRARFG